MNGPDEVLCPHKQEVRIIFGRLARRGESRDLDLPGGQPHQQGIVQGAIMTEGALWAVCPRIEREGAIDTPQLFMSIEAAQAWRNEHRDEAYLPPISIKALSDYD